MLIGGHRRRRSERRRRRRPDPPVADLSGLGGGVPAAVRVDDVAHQPVPYDVLAGEPAELHVVDAVEDLLHDAQPALGAARQVDLGDVAGDDHLRAEAEPGEEHLHLLRRGVLRLVQDDERVIEGVVRDEEVAR